MTPKSPSSLRYHLLDQLRGLAVVLMIIFHSAYDLNYFGIYDMNYPENRYWYALPRFIVFLFLICVGMGLFEAHVPTFHFKKFLSRLRNIVLFAIIISVVTYFLFPDRWIYFGTLHCIALSSVIGIPFLRFPLIGGLIGLGIVVCDFIFGVHLPWFNLSHPSMDYIPLLPWCGFTLIGISIAKLGWHKVKIPKISPLEYLGKHALIIYIIHQPVLFGLTYAIYWLNKS